MRRSSKKQKAQAQKIKKERSKMPKGTEDENNCVIHHSEEQLVE